MIHKILLHLEDGFRSIEDEFKNQVNEFKKSCMEYELYPLASLADRVLMDKIILRARKRSNFNLGKHVESMKTDRFPEVPKCNCLYCRTLYAGKLHRREFLNIRRNVEIIRMNERRLTSEDPYVRANQKRKQIDPNFVNSYPIVSTISPLEFAVKQAVLANIHRRKANGCMKLAKKLYYILQIPEILVND